MHSSRCITRNRLTGYFGSRNLGHGPPDPQLINHHPALQISEPYANPRSRPRLIHPGISAPSSSRFRLLESPGLFAVLSRWSQRRARVAPSFRARKPRKQIAHSSRETAQAKSNASNEACPDDAIPESAFISYSSVPVNLPTPQTNDSFLLYNKEKLLANGDRAKAEIAANLHSFCLGVLIMYTADHVYRLHVCSSLLLFWTCN